MCLSARSQLQGLHALEHCWLMSCTNRRPSDPDLRRTAHRLRFQVGCVSSANRSRRDAFVCVTLTRGEKSGGVDVVNMWIVYASLARHNSCCAGGERMYVAVGARCPVEGARRRATCVACWLCCVAATGSQTRVNACTVSCSDETHDKSSRRRRTAI